jgi:FlaA1/EpsC-like NDP-sugar epimerase
MTRFNITLNQGVQMVIHALDDMQGGEIYVPRIPSYRILDLVTAIAPDCATQVVGIRPGEKLHEEMITTSDAPSTLAFRNHFIICPSNRAASLEQEQQVRGGDRCADGFCYNSRDNPNMLSVEQIRHLIRQNVDPHFRWSDS